MNQQNIKAKFLARKLKAASLLPFAGIAPAAIPVIAAIVVTLTGCEMVYNMVAPKCDCKQKEHLGIGEHCCDKNNCTCRIKVYATFSDAGGNKVSIYREGTIAEPIMATAADNVQIAHAGLDMASRNALRGKMSAVHLLPGKNYGCELADDEKFIIKLGAGMSSNEMKEKYLWVVNNVL